MQLSERDCPVCTGHIEVYQGPKDKRPYFICLRCNTKGDEKLLPFVVFAQMKRKTTRQGERTVWLC